MTEAETMMVFSEYMVEINQLYINYISVISAFLIMSYFSAHRLSDTLMYIIILLFTVVASVLIFTLFLVNNDIDNLYAYIIEQKASGAFVLPWFGHNPNWASRVLTVFHVLSTFGGYVGCLFFFFYQRKHGSSDGGT